MLLSLKLIFRFSLIFRI